MEALTGYGSDSEEEEEEKQVVYQKPASIAATKQSLSKPAKEAGAAYGGAYTGTVTTGTGSSNVNNSNSNNSKIQNTEKNKKKKTKKLDISFLPKEIQDALARGDTALDSDDDGDDLPLSRQPPVPASHSQPSETGSSKAAQQAKGLLAMLPKPTQALPPPRSNGGGIIPVDSDGEGDNEGINVAMANSDAVDGEEESEPSIAQPVTSQFHQGSATVQLSSGQTEGNNEKEESENDDDNGEDWSYLEILKQHHSSSSSASLFNLNVQRPVVSSSSSIVDVPPAAPIMIPRTTNWHDEVAPGPSLPSDDVRRSYGLGAGFDETAFDDQYQQSTGSKRKRDRDMELQLLQGNIAVMTEDHISEVVHPSAWNAKAYTEQLEKEKELKAAYNMVNAGGAITSLPPSRTQNRKHQINSLAFRAAETELKMLEMKAQKGKTKSETQGRYGW